MVVFGDDDVFECLQVFVIVFFYFDVDYYGVVGVEVWQLVGDLFGFELFDDFVYGNICVKCNNCGYVLVVLLCCRYLWWNLFSSVVDFLLRVCCVSRLGWCSQVCFSDCFRCQWWIVVWLLDSNIVGMLFSVLCIGFVQCG